MESESSGKENSQRQTSIRDYRDRSCKSKQQKRNNGQFHRLIKPQVYNWIHDSIHEVIHVDYKDLMSGVPFEQAAREFLDWCGEDWYFLPGEIRM